MTRSSNQKMKPLYLEKILYEQTDDDHPLTALEIAEALAAYDVPASRSRKSIYDDIDALRQYGMDIEHRGGKDGGYFVATREFELAELKLLVDAVQSSRLVTGRKCTELIKKLSQLASKAQGKQLNRQVYTARQARALNETVFYSIDAIHAAILQTGRH
jgi:predicted DNA-binding transcriptional regulator YafY